jgi:hypothetical protein
MSSLCGIRALQKLYFCNVMDQTTSKRKTVGVILTYADGKTTQLGLTDATFELKEADLSFGVTAIKVNTEDYEKKGKTICYYGSS